MIPCYNSTFKLKVAMGWFRAELTHDLKEQRRSEVPRDGTTECLLHNQEDEMKEIVAIIRPNQWQNSKAKLLEEGFTSFTIQRVYGRGRQKGLQYLKSGKIEEGIRFLPKRMLTLLVKDEDVPAVTELLVLANQTGEIGDGKIFVCPLETVERIRTSEKGEEVLI